MCQGNASLRHHLDQIPGTQLETQVPPHAEDNDFAIEVSPLKQIHSGRSSAHSLIMARQRRSSVLHQNPHNVYLPQTAPWVHVFTAAIVRRSSANSSTPSTPRSLTIWTVSLSCVCKATMDSWFLAFRCCSTAKLDWTSLNALRARCTTVATSQAGSSDRHRPLSL